MTPWTTLVMSMTTPMTKMTTLVGEGEIISFFPSVSWKITGYELTVTNWRLQTDGTTDGGNNKRMDGRTDRRTDGLTGQWTDRPSNRVDMLRLKTLMVKETYGIEYFCCWSSTQSNSQSERYNFGYGPIREEICLTMSGELRIYRSKWPICMKEPYHFK